MLVQTRSLRPGAATVAALAVAALACAACSRTRGSRQPLAPGALRGFNVLLVTIDTLRADRVGAYGASLGLTPTIDALAREGLRFERTYAHVPLTLPSHATLMTGSYPPHTGVRDNGAFRLAPSADTLAGRLKAAGYRTGAFLGSFVLDARFGLNRGFDTYDDRMHSSAHEGDAAERRADQVAAPAADWILGGGALSHDQRPAPPPFFAWVHLYDPHEPYDPPEPFRSRYSGQPYDGEIAYADAVLGTFLSRLRSAGALDRTLIVVASDHGEALGDHRERTHGLFAYESTIRVPLVMWSGGRVNPGVFEPTIRLVDVAPTILDLVGAPPLTGTDGRSVRPFVAGEQAYDEPGSYFEALNANLARDWAPLTGLVRERTKLVDLPIPELYDLAADPGEAHNIYARDPERARDLEVRLDRITRTTSASTSAPIDADAAARLRSLGYVVASGPKPARTYTAADDPKQLVHLNVAMDDAAALWRRGDAAQAIETLRQVVRERPTLSMAYDRLAFMLRSTGRLREAIEVLDAAARGGHADRALLRSFGGLLRDAGDLKRSAAVLEPLVSGDATDLQSADALGQTYARMGRIADAEALFRRVLAASPNAATTWNNLGSTYLAAGRLDEAVDALTRALAIDPDLATAHNGLGVAYARRGDTTRAVEEWRIALELRPGYADARENLARLAAFK